MTTVLPEHAQTSFILESPNCVEDTEEMVNAVPTPEQWAITENLYRQQSEPLRSWLRAKMTDEHSVEDVVQETFRRIAVAKKQFDPEIGKPGHWVQMFGSSVLMDYFRKHYKQTERYTLKAEVTEPQAVAQVSAQDYENVIGSLVVSKLLKKCAERLSPDQWQVFERSFAGVPYPQIAKELNIPVGTVKTRMNRARLALGEYREVMRSILTA